MNVHCLKGTLGGKRNLNLQLGRRRKTEEGSKYCTQEDTCPSLGAKFFLTYKGSWETTFGLKRKRRGVLFSTTILPTPSLKISSKKKKEKKKFCVSLVNKRK